MSDEINQGQAQFFKRMFERYTKYIETGKPVWELEANKTDFNSARLQLFNAITGEIFQLNLTNEQILILNRLDLFSEDNKDLLEGLLKKIEAEEDNS